MLGERVKLILMSAGFNNVDLEAVTKYGITVMRVPGYSPEAAAEHAMVLAMAVNRHLHKSYVCVKIISASSDWTGVNFTENGRYRRHRCDQRVEGWHGSAMDLVAKGTGYTCTKIQI